MDPQQAAAAIGSWLFSVVTAAGGSALLLVAIVKLFGETWINNRFAQNLETFRHQQSLQAEKFRHDINTEFDRLTKINQRQFEILPALWESIVEAHGHAAAFTSFFQQYPDLSRMETVELEEFIAKTDLQDWQKKEILNSYDKNKLYQKAIFWVRLNSANEKLYAHRRFLRKNSIFVSDEVRAEIEKIEELIRSAILEYEVYHDTDSVWKETKARTALREEGQEALTRIEREIRKSLWARP